MIANRVTQNFEFRIAASAHREVKWLPSELVETPTPYNQCIAVRSRSLRLQNLNFQHERNHESALRNAHRNLRIFQKMHAYHAGTRTGHGTPLWATSPESIVTLLCHAERSRITNELVIQQKNMHHIYSTSSESTLNTANSSILARWHHQSVAYASNL